MGPVVEATTYPRIRDVEAYLDANDAADQCADPTQNISGFGSLWHLASVDDPCALASLEH